MVIMDKQRPKDLRKYNSMIILYLMPKAINHRCYIFGQVVTKNSITVI
jgi:hypothetical protein